MICANTTTKKHQLMQNSSALVCFYNSSLPFLAHAMFCSIKHGAFLFIFFSFRGTCVNYSELMQNWGKM